MLKAYSTTLDGRLTKFKVLSLPLLISASWGFNRQISCLWSHHGIARSSVNRGELSWNKRCGQTLPWTGFQRLSSIHLHRVSQRRPKIFFQQRSAISPEQLHVARTNLTPEIPRTAAATNSLHISQLSTANRDSSCDASSDNDALDVDDEYEEDEEDESENALVESDHFSKNIFSALDLLSTPDAAATTTDTSASLSKYSLGVCNQCVTSCEWVIMGKSMCACCGICCGKGSFKSW